MPSATSLTIFKTGQHIDNQGQPFAIDQQALQQLAQNYHPEQHEAPLVIGHPSDDAPAYGWIKALRIKDDCLIADIEQLHQDVVSMVKKGAFRKLSASFYPAQSSLNPTPGQLSLRHVGLLGAQPPAIKGLPSVQFQEHSTPLIHWKTEFTRDAVADGVDQNTMTRLMHWLRQKLDRQSYQEIEQLLHEEQNDTLETSTEMVTNEPLVEKPHDNANNNQTTDASPATDATSAQDWAPKVQRIAATLPAEWDEQVLRQFIDRLQQLLQTEKNVSAQFSELSAPAGVLPVASSHDVSDLIAHAHALVKDAQSHGRGLNFAEAVTLAQQENNHAK